MLTSSFILHTWLNNIDTDCNLAQTTNDLIYEENRERLDDCATNDIKIYINFWLYYSSLWWYHILLSFPSFECLCLFFYSLKMEILQNDDCFYLGCWICACERVMFCYPLSCDQVAGWRWWWSLSRSLRSRSHSLSVHSPGPSRQIAKQKCLDEHLGVEKVGLTWRPGDWKSGGSASRWYWKNRWLETCQHTHLDLCVVADNVDFRHAYARTTSVHKHYLN